MLTSRPEPDDKLTAMAAAGVEREVLDHLRREIESLSDAELLALAYGTDDDGADEKPPPGIAPGLS
jgi:hypothetical protein